jgi:N-acetyl-alpha-D-glucosaminyl L-malate synthase BshA
MRIGVVCYPTYGGSGVVATELGKALAERGHRIDFITYDRPVRLNTFSTQIYYHQVNPGRYPLFDYLPYETALASKLVEVVRYAKLELLHVHYAIPHASSAFLAQQILRDVGIEVPFITTLHGTDITLVGKEESYAPVVAFSINHSNAVTAVSNYLKRITLSTFQIRRPIEVIYNFVELNRFAESSRIRGERNCFAPQRELLLMHASNFRKVKRIGDVYEIFRRVRTHLPVRLILLGDGPERSVLERQVWEDQLHEEVVFLGSHQDIEHILPMGDLFLLPSESESFGLAALEAMACGLPVVATRAGGLPELVEHGVSGLLSDVGDVEDMAANAIQILGDQSTKHEFSLQARIRAESFSLDQIVPHYEELYQSLI